MADKKLRFEVEADTTDAEKDLAKLETKVDKLEGEKVEVPITADASELERATEDASAALKELASETPKVTLEVDDTALRSAAARAKTSLDDVGKSAGSSKSVLANMVGNATQDLGALSGIAGSAGVAIGQMGEYMADAASAGEGIGSIAKNFATVLGPVAAISLGVGLLTTVFGNMAKSAEEAKKRAEEFAKAVEASGGNVEAAFAKLAEAGQFDDLIDDLDRLGLTYRQFVDLASGGAIKIDPVRADALSRIQGLEKLFKTTGAQTYRKQVAAIADEMGVSTDEALKMAKSLDKVTEGADKSADAIANAIDAYAAQRRVMQDNADLLDIVNRAVELNIDTTGKSEAQLQREVAALERSNEVRSEYAAKLRDSNSAVTEHADAVEDAARAADEAAAAYGREQQAFSDLNDEYDARRGGILDQAELRVRLADAQKAYAESLADEEATVDERVVNAQRVAEGFAAIMGAIAAANGTPFDRDGAILNALKETAKQASGPTKTAIEDVIRALEKVPSDVHTSLTADNSQMIAEIQESMRALAALQREADKADLAFAAAAAASGGGRVHQGGTQGVGITQNITVNAGFGTDAFAVRQAVLGSARQAARLTQNATRFAG